MPAGNACDNISTAGIKSIEMHAVNRLGNQTVNNHFIAHHTATLRKFALSRQWHEQFSWSAETVHQLLMVGSGDLIILIILVSMNN